VDASKKSQKVLGIIGCGWLGTAVAAHFIQHNWIVKGTRRSEEKMAHLELLGVQPFKFELGTTALQQNFCEHLDLLLISIPPQLRANDNNTFINNMKSLCKELHRALPENCQVIYTSSTGVYPKSGGPFSELSQWTADSERAQKLLTAEEAIAALPHKKTILRLAGLVGPDREPVRSLSGRTHIAGGNKAANLIHQKDVVKLIWSLSKEADPAPIINGVFPQNIKKSDFYKAKALQLNIPPPLFDHSNKPIDRLIHSKVFLGFTYDQALL
jgi:nucleoside-diphosphate-sugar epimerase